MTTALRTARLLCRDICGGARDDYGLSCCWSSHHWACYAVSPRLSVSRTRGGDVSWSLSGSGAAAGAAQEERP